MIVNFNGMPFIEGLMLSLKNQTYRDSEVIFVDNASTDDSVNKLQEILKGSGFSKMRVRIVVNPSNLGYCVGNNRAWSIATGKYVIFLNNDTFVDSDWLKELVKFMDSRSSIGACQSRIISIHTGQTQTAGMLFDAYGWSIGMQGTEYGSSTKVFYPSGASVIVRKPILEKLEGFDEFTFYGDYDLGWRIRLLGYDIGVCPQSVCHHYGGYATKILLKDSEQMYHSYRERIFVLLKNYSFSRVATRLPVSLILMWASSMVWSWKGRRTDSLSSFVRAVNWNLKAFSELLIRRRRTQNWRVVSDDVIDKAMSRCLVIRVLSGLVQNHSGRT